MNSHVLDSWVISPSMIVNNKSDAHFYQESDIAMEHHKSVDNAFIQMILLSSELHGHATNAFFKLDPGSCKFLLPISGESL